MWSAAKQTALPVPGCCQDRFHLTAGSERGQWAEYSGGVLGCWGGRRGGFPSPIPGVPSVPLPICSLLEAPGCNKADHQNRGD